MVCVLWFVFSGQNVVQLHVGYSKYPKEQLQSFREDVILANHAHVSLLWPLSAQNQTCTALWKRRLPKVVYFHLNLPQVV